MINPTILVSNILKNDPDLAQDVLDLLICATDPAFRDSNEYDEIKDLLFMKLQAGRTARDSYIESRKAA